MKFKEITFSESVEHLYTPYLKKWTRMGVSIEIQEGEPACAAMDAAQKFIDEEMHKRISINPTDNIEKKDKVVEKIPDEVMSTIEAIMNCESVEKLQTDFWLMSKSNLNYKSAYEKRFKQLNDATKQY